MTQQHPTINPRTYLTLYLEEKYDDLSDAFIQVLEYFENFQYYEVTQNLQYFTDVFVNNFLYFFSQPDYMIGDRHAIRYIKLNPVIANLTAISNQKTTDFHLKLLQQQPQNFIKILTLLNARSTIEVNYKKLFDTNPQLASIWYSSYTELYISSLANPVSLNNLRKHIQYIDDDRLADFPKLADVYFGATYIDQTGDRQIKERINTAIRNSTFCTNANITNSPNKRKIAVITGLWHEHHSVYRTLSEFIDSLKEDYKITLIYLGNNRPDINANPFSSILHLDTFQGKPDISPIRKNDYNIIYYPDIGMSPESILLSNLRLAPIQIVGTGHPVSTFGSEIDYFISGDNVESQNLCVNNYEERVILLPGNGAIHNLPYYKPRNPKKIDTNSIVINCSWLSQKVNFPIIQLLARIKEQAKHPILFRFFSGNILKNGFIPFVRDLTETLGEKSVEVILGKPYEDYMALMEEGDISLDPYPFGGSNIMADSLYLRKPTVGYEGTKWPNRIGSQMLRQVGLEELVAKNGNEYIQYAAKLINDASYRQDVGDRLKNVDLNTKIFEVEDKHYFKKAIDYLIKNHAKLKASIEKTPIRIEK